MAYIRKSDGSRKYVTDEEVWGKPLTEEEQILEDRKKVLPVTRTQFAIALAAQGIVSPQEAKDFAGGNALPTFATEAIEGSSMSAVEKMAAEIKALSVLLIRRDNPIVSLLAASKSLTEVQVDNLFKLAVSID